MPNATIIISGYSGSYSHLNGTKRITISKADIARGLLSIGKTHWLEHFKTPGKTINDFLNHWTGLNSFIDTRPELRMTARYNALDGTDKTVKSYHIGMGIAKIVAERVLGVPYLQHVDALENQGIVTLTAGTRQRGDMVGMDKLVKWHVIEAKGRTGKPSKKDFKDAKQQAERITSISGMTPSTKSYCVTSLSTTGSKIYLHDPDDLPINEIQLEMDRDKFVKFYYDRLFSLFYRQPADITMQVTTLTIQMIIKLFRLRESDYYVGLPESYLTDLASGSVRFAYVSEERPAQNPFQEFQELENNYLSFGSDGIVLMHRDFIPGQDQLLKSKINLL